MNALPGCHITLEPRYVRQEGNLRPFQAATLEALAGTARLVFLEAPVGAGKSHLLRPFLAGALERPLVLTFPTKILMQAQVGLLRREFPRASHWPDSPQSAPSLTIFEYSTDALVRFLRQNPDLATVDRSQLLKAILERHGWQCRKNLLVTTPDVLYLIQQNCYRSSHWLTAMLHRPVVFFDEFHLYTNLRAFAPLVEWLLDVLQATVVFLSATPTSNADLDRLKERFPTLVIPFAESAGDSKDVCFNHPLDLQVVPCVYTKPEVLLETLRRVLPLLAKPCAIIFDSVFRLRHLEPRLRRAFPGFAFFEYSGMKHDRIPFSENTVVLGTSSIEVGVEMPIKSLITEAAFWTSAIQRLGRVGRREPGQAILLTRRNLEPYLGGRSCFDRGQFEREVLQEGLGERMGGTSLVAGEMFRGDSRPFLVVDHRTHDLFPYTEAVFSMFEIEPSFCQNWRRLTMAEKKGCLREEFEARSEQIDEVLLRDRLIPFWGVVTGRLRQTYEPVFAQEAEGGLQIRVGAGGLGGSFFFDDEEESA
ncbi:MAG: type I-D CRISPR-associated helicase Cas3' [Candidatus Riflebacteria bacterium]|nr:type I-D CRISPR-associated helicase Cas3' [Candidatus Riflebacteria bacterium]